MTRGNFHGRKTPSFPFVRCSFQTFTTSVCHFVTFYSVLEIALLSASQSNRRQNFLGRQLTGFLRCNAEEKLEIMNFYQHVSLSRCKNLCYCASYGSIVLTEGLVFIKINQIKLKLQNNYLNAFTKIVYSTSRIRGSTGLRSQTVTFLLSTCSYQVILSKDTTSGTTSMPMTLMYISHFTPVTPVR